jgi:hypothetical protein
MNKILNLFNNYPVGIVLTTTMLFEAGYTPQLLHKYTKSGWLEHIGSGAYKRSGDKISWEGAIWSLQKEGKGIYVSGKTALEHQGYEHFLSMGRRKIYVSYDQHMHLPKWLKFYDFGVDFVFIRSDDIDPKYLTNLQISNISLTSSCPEFASLEICAGLPKYYTFDTAFYIFESLLTLRADFVQEILEDSSNIKAKRLFLYFASQNSADFFNGIDQSKIDIGKGKRQIAKDGVLDPKYQITVPRPRLY